MTSTYTEWTDWALPPAVGSTTVSDDVILTVDGLLILEANSSELPNAVLFLRTTCVADTLTQVAASYGVDVGEGFETVGGVNLTLVEGRIHLVPLSSLAPEFRLVCVSRANALDQLSYKFVTRTQLPNTLSMALDSPTLADTHNVAAGGSFPFFPAQITPGRVGIAVVTNAAIYQVAMRIWHDGTYTDVPIGSNVTPVPIGFDYIVPASSWAIVVTNGDGVARDFTVIGSMIP